MTANGFDLAAAARQTMIDEGFHPDFPADALREVQSLKGRPAPRAEADVRDLRGLLWSSIDNDTSRDLDQAEVAERVEGGIRVLVAIADVDTDVPAGSPIDRHAASETTSVYTGVRVFPMLPEELSTGLTSLNENEDRLAIVTEFMVAADGAVSGGCVYRALVRNQAQLAYNSLGAWFEGRGEAPAEVAASGDLKAQLGLQDEAAQLLAAERHRMGALNLDRLEAEPVLTDGHISGIEVRRKNRATELIENFMVAANGVMARTLADAGVSSLARVVRTPERWARIVALAEQYGEKLPADPDSGA
ncbi:MAG TPA: ribonuclease catalytic domain-containing protein, partial [Bryobacteraceae bacterium]|nr:ribonuclease catalytic domain-containing protein [Bryobacteraceae bacterium]